MPRNPSAHPRKKEQQRVECLKDGSILKHPYPWGRKLSLVIPVLIPGSQGFLPGCWGSGISGEFVWILGQHSGCLWASHPTAGLNTAQGPQVLENNAAGWQESRLRSRRLVAGAGLTKTEPLLRRISAMTKDDFLTTRNAFH